LTLTTRVGCSSSDHITKLVSANRIPVSITKSGDGLVFAALGRLLWTEEVAEAVQTITKKMDDNGVSGSRLLWTEGEMSKSPFPGPRVVIFNASGLKFYGKGWIFTRGRF